MQKLSVVLATFNEEENLRDCLKSVTDIASEIVIVDGSSTDKTVEIAKEFNARIKVTDNPPIFHINKQKAIDLATDDWILQLDADERVTLELRDEIEQVINNSTLQNNNSALQNGYWIPRKNWFLGRFLTKGGQYPDYTLRLYRRGKGQLPQKSVHEQAIVNGKLGYLKNPLIHMADPSFKRYLTRFNRYTALDANELLEKDSQKKLPERIIEPFIFLIVRPIWWFLKTYFRHKGFFDSWQGFIFSFFSSLRFPVIYIKYLKKKQF